VRNRFWYTIALPLVHNQPRANHSLSLLVSLVLITALRARQYLYTLKLSLFFLKRMCCQVNNNNTCLIYTFKGHWHKKSVSNKLIGRCLTPSIITVFKNVRSIDVEIFLTVAPDCRLIWFDGPKLFHWNAVWFFYTYESYERRAQIQCVGIKTCGFKPV
jgi:hypothetical protein